MEVDGPQNDDKTSVMDVSMDGDNLELPQQVKEFHVVVSMLRSVMEEMLTVKKNDPTLERSETVPRLTALRGRVHMLFLELKQLNRSICFLGHAMKTTVQTTKVSQTQVNLDLQGLVYERSHFEKEINKCRDFKTAADDLSMISEDAYLKLPEGQRSQDKHDLMLSRLAHEIKSRQELLVTLDKLKASRAEVEQRTKTHYEFIQSINNQIKTLLVDATRVQQQLPGSAMLLPPHPKSTFLPKPLYNLYNILLCYQGYYDPSIQIKIMGDAATNDEKDEVSEITIHTPSTTNSSTSSTTNNNNNTNTNTTPSLDVQPHSLAITLTTTFVDKTEVAFLFRYLLPLGIVTVSHTGRGSWDSLMINLSPQDTGEELPNNLNSATFQSAKLDTKKFGRAFRWLQSLCGLHFNAPDQTESSSVSASSSSLSRPSLNIASLLARLRHRAAIRVSLQKQFNQLQKKAFPSENCLDDFGPNGVKPKPVLTRWAKARPEDFFKLDRANDSKDIHAPEWYQVCAEYYQFAFTKGSITLEGVVEISPEYPIRPPSFRLFFTKGVSDKGLVPNPLVKSTANPEALTLSMTKGTSSEFSNDLFDIQVEVNCNFPRPLREIAEAEEKGDNVFLLSYQLKKIQVCFDLLSVPPAASGLALSQLIRGRDRRRPLVYDPKEQIHRHSSFV